MEIVEHDLSDHRQIVCRVCERTVAACQCAACRHRQRRRIVTVGYCSDHRAVGNDGDE
jgi:hypothetical protein